MCREVIRMGITNSNKQINVSRSTAKGSYRFLLITLSAIWITAPVFLLLGAVLPAAVYRSVSKKTIVERLREIE